MKILQTLVRVYTGDLKQSLRFYEGLTGMRAKHRFAMPAAGLELAVVGNVLIISGSDVALRPFRQTDATFLVDSLDEYHRFLSANGGMVLSPPRQVASGITMTVRHPDGFVAEYVEHRNLS